MQVLSEPAETEAPANRSLEQFRENLIQILENNRAPYMVLGPEEALLSVKSGNGIDAEEFGFGRIRCPRSPSSTDLQRSDRNSYARFPREPV